MMKRILAGILWFIPVFVAVTLVAALLLFAVEGGSGPFSLRMVFARIGAVVWIAAIGLTVIGTATGRLPGTRSPSSPSPIQR